MEALSMPASLLIKTVKSPDKKPGISDRSSFLRRRSVKFQFVQVETVLQHFPGQAPLLRRGLFVMWGGWGERKRERAGHDGKRRKRRETSAI